jgi:acetyl-CoA carboxylase carboxyltransferase component
MDKLQQDSRTAFKRLESLFDRGTFVALEPLAAPDAEETAADGDGARSVAAGYGALEGRLVFAFSQNRAVCGGAVGRAQARRIARLYGLAAKAGAPVAAVFDSLGAKLDEGGESLAAYGEIIAQMSSLSGVVPQVALVLGVCAGAAALAACCADVVIADRQAELYLAGAATPGQRQAQGAYSAHIVAEDEAGAVLFARRLLGMLPRNNLDTPAALPAAGINRASPLLASLAAGFDPAAPQEAPARMARIIGEIFDPGSVMTLGHGPAGEQGVTTAFARLAGRAVGILAAAGFIGAAQARAACGFVRLCDSFGVPLLTFADTPGFLPGEAEGPGSAAALACALAEAAVPKVSLIVGQAYGSAYVALAGAAASDLTFAWPGVRIGPLPAGAAVAFLWKSRLREMENPLEDRKKLEEEFARTRLSPQAAAEDGLIDGVVEPESTRARLFSALDMLAGKRTLRYPRKHVDLPF